MSAGWSERLGMWGGSCAFDQAGEANIDYKSSDDDEGI